MKYTIQILIFIFFFALISCDDKKEILEDNTGIEDIINTEEEDENNTEGTTSKMTSTNIKDAEGLYLICYRRENTPTQYIDTLMIIDKNKGIRPLEFIKPDGVIINICSRQIIPLNKEWILLRNDDVRFQSIYDKKYSHYLVNRVTGEVKVIPTSANFNFSKRHLLHEDMQTDASGSIYLPGSTTIYKLNLNSDAYEITPSKVTSFLQPYNEGHQDHFFITKENAIYCMTSSDLNFHYIIFPDGKFETLFKTTFNPNEGLIDMNNLCTTNQKHLGDANFFLDANKQLYFSCSFEKLNEQGKKNIYYTIFKINIESSSLTCTKVAEEVVLSDLEVNNTLSVAFSRPVFYPQNGNLYSGLSYTVNYSDPKDYSILIFNPKQSKINKIKTENKYIYSYHMDQYGPLYHTQNYLIGSAYVYSKHAFSSFNMNTYEEKVHTTENYEMFPLYEPDFYHVQTHIHYARHADKMYFPKIEYINGIGANPKTWISHYSLLEQKETIISLGDISSGEEIVITMLD